MIQKVIMEKNCTDTHVRDVISSISHRKTFEDTITALMYLLMMFACSTSVVGLNYPF